MVADLLAGQPLVGYDPDAVYAAAVAVRSYCGWHIAPSIEETVYVDGYGLRDLVLPSLCVTAVAGVVENTITLDPGVYRIHRGCMLRRTSPWLWEEVAVTITHGYISCPLDVRAVIARLAKAGVAPARQPSTVTVGGVSKSYPATAVPADAIDEYAARVLDRYALGNRP